jgi:hypothetical protein
MGGGTSCCTELADERSQRRGGDERAEPLSLGHRDAGPKAREPIVTPALVVELRDLPRIAGDDQPVADEALEHLVQVSRLESNGATGAVSDRLRQTVAVLLLFGEGDEDEKRCGSVGMKALV